jgi:hypothetical protein
MEFRLLNTSVEPFYYKHLHIYLSSAFVILYFQVEHTMSCWMPRP